MEERELVQAVIDAGLNVEWGDDDAKTSKELSEESGLEVRRVREILGGLAKEGYIEAVYVMRETLRTPLTGRLSRVPGYRYTKKGKDVLGSPSLKA